MVFAPFSAVYFVVYEQLKKRFPVMSMYMQLVAHSLITSIASAGIAGATAAAVTCPLDVVKTRLQVCSLAMWMN